MKYHARIYSDVDIKSIWFIAHSYQYTQQEHVHLLHIELFLLDATTQPMVGATGRLLALSHVTNILLF